MGVLYVPVIAFSSMLVGPRWILVLAALSTGLLLLGWAFSPVGGIPWMGAANRLASILAIWSIVVSSFQRHRNEAGAARGLGRAGDVGVQRGRPPDVRV